MSFSELGLSAQAVAAAAAEGFVQPTPIQQQAITPVLQKRDVVGHAQTGSGKTLAYALPLLDRLTAQSAARPMQIQVLILVPTRELAVQVGTTLQGLARHFAQAPKMNFVYGGVSINPQMMALRGGTQLVVATPGRLLDLLDHNALNLNAVGTLVLDEADRLLELGFSQELQRIQSLLPKQLQTLLFSATFPSSVMSLVQEMTEEPVEIDIQNASQSPVVITHRAIATDSTSRTQLLRHLIQSHQWTRVLVFVATKHAAEIVADKLRKAKIAAEPFHGLLSQGKRTQVLADFKASRITAVVATDLAARGIDISQLPVVVNYDLPRSAVEYTHRVGRTGRAGDAGLAVTLVTPDTHAHFALIQKRNSVQMSLETIAGFESKQSVPPEMGSPTTQSKPDQAGGIKGRRPNKKDKLRAAANSTR